MAAPLAVLADASLLRRLTSFMAGVPFLLLELQRSVPSDEWSARQGDSALVARDAIRRNDRRVLQMLRNVHCAASPTLKGALGSRLRFEDALLWAVRLGEICTLAWMHESFPDLKASVLRMDAAIKIGRVDLLDFLYTRCKHNLGDTKMLGSSLAFAPRERWLAVAEWLNRHGEFQDCFSGYVLERVVESGDAEMFEFLHACRPESTSSGHLMHLAARAGNLAAVRLLSSDPRTTKSMDVAAQNGHLDVVRFLHKERHEACSAFAMNSAARNGFLDVVEYLHGHRAEGCTVAALNGAAQNGHLAVVKFLVENRHEGDLEAARVQAEENGQEAVNAYLQQAIESSRQGG